MKLDSSDNSWLMFLSIIRKAKDAHVSWESPKQERPYWIKSFDSKAIIIKRYNANDEKLTKNAYLTFIERINKAKSIRRSECSNLRVATMATLVYFHPMLQWEENNNLITIKKNGIEGTVMYEDFGVPPNDDVTELQLFASKVRRGQSKYRNALFKNYNNKCCISGCNVEEVLEACHIEPHSKNGNNSLENGLLLRADLHTLFDLHLISISPKDYKIHVSKSLRKTEYYAFNGSQLHSCIKKPSTLHLQAHWNIFNTN